MTTSKNEDPWVQIGANVNSIRVNEHDPWDFFWARGNQGEFILLMNHLKTSSEGIRLPQLKNIDIQLNKQNDDKRTLAFRLEEPDNKDIFYQLCVDIIAQANVASTEKEAITFAMKRTWRWHHLLRGGRSKLSLEEQKGLIGELVVLKEIMLPDLSAREAVDSWIGPTGAPKDFQFGATAIEAKARRGGSLPFVSISSEHQLDDSGLASLYLHVVELDRQSSNDSESFSLTEKCYELREQIASSDEEAANDFDANLTSVGFNYEEDYSDTHWILVNRHLYEVQEEFPRITANQITSGVNGVSYSISLHQCEPFRCDLKEINF